MLKKAVLLTPGCLWYLVPLCDALYLNGAKNTAIEDLDKISESKQDFSEKNHLLGY